MNRTDETDHHALEEMLASAPKLPGAEWERIRRDLARRADAAGFLDVAFARHDSPLGTILLGATRQGLVRVGLPTEPEREVLDDLARRVSPRMLATMSKPLDVARRELDEYFEGRRRAFAVALDWRLVAGFRRQVLQATARIPYGETRTYREVAIRAGRPAAVRATGTALAANPLPIFVPCHRVLRTGGGLGGYRGGLEAKARLLRLERATA